MRLIPLSFVCLLLFPSLLLAEAGVKPGSETTDRRGLITSGACPLSCKDLNVPEEQCRTWQQGNTCMVEDLGQPAGHRSVFKVQPSSFSDVRSAAPRAGETAARVAPAGEDRRGLVTSSSCPYTCKMARIPSDQCREWQQGDKCLVEDLMQPAGHRSLIRVPQ